MDSLKLLGAVLILVIAGILIVGKDILGIYDPPGEMATNGLSVHKALPMQEFDLDAVEVNKTLDVYTNEGEIQPLNDCEILERQVVCTFMVPFNYRNTNGVATYVERRTRLIKAFVTFSIKFDQWEDITVQRTLDGWKVLSR